MQRGRLACAALRLMAQCSAATMAPHTLTSFPACIPHPTPTTICKHPPLLQGPLTHIPSPQHSLHLLATCLATQPTTADAPVPHPSSHTCHYPPAHTKPPTSNPHPHTHLQEVWHPLPRLLEQVLEVQQDALLTLPRVNEGGGHTRLAATPRTPNPVCSRWAYGCHARSREVTPRHGSAHEKMGV
jgi:hypothetical protein